MVRFRTIFVVVGLFAWLGIQSTEASFHFMQIEQVIGGVNGDLTAQAIQLRQRAGGQNFVASSRVNVRDAAGLNPILIVDMTTNVANGGAGRRVLIASSSFLAQTSPATVPDFMMTNLIPASYLCAGSLTFEDDFGTIYWRLSWGGANYTGPGTGSATNDANGQFNPPFGSALPSGTLQSLLFPGAFGAMSTTNAADYMVTAGASVWTNNANTAFTLIGGAFRGACCNQSMAMCTNSVLQANCGAPLVWTQGTPCCGVACLPTGACCNESTGVCMDNVTLANCSPPQVWTQGMACSMVTCEPAIGACCNTMTFACMDGVTMANCSGPNQQWTQDVLCADLNPPCAPPPTGACCDDSSGVCTEDVTQAACLGRYGGDDSTCATINPPCVAPLGACCDLPEGGCTNDMTFANCQPPLVWNEGFACKDACPPGACCEPTAPTCTDGIIEPNCQSPLIFTANAMCADVMCPPAGIPCDVDADCHDDDVCTCDTCQSGFCTSSPITFGNTNCSAFTQPNLDDILFVLADFQDGGSVTHPSNDLSGQCMGNHIINLDDILAVLGAFGGVDPCGC